MEPDHPWFAGWRIVTNTGARFLALVCPACFPGLHSSAIRWSAVPRGLQTWLVDVDQGCSECGKLPGADHGR